MLIGLMLTVHPAQAHSINESYVYFDVSDTALSGRVEVNTLDLAKAFDGGAEVETPWTRDQVFAAQDQLFAFFPNVLALQNGEAPLGVTFREIGFLEGEMSDGSEIAQLYFDVEGLTETPDTLGLSYTFMFEDLDPSHRGFALIAENTRTGVENNESHISLIFGPGDGFKTLYLSGEPIWNVLKEFLIHGVWHIWLGFDHILFLIALLLTAVLIPVQNRWEPAPSLGAAIRKTLGIVTIFTVAHSVTLVLAALQIVMLPAVLVESIIALSIAFAALMNFFPAVRITTWQICLVFGLFHGFGFANVLAPLGLEPLRIAYGLAAFNVGVELGQVAIVLVVFPVLFAIRATRLYRVAFLNAGSVALIAIAMFWFFERALSGLF